MNNTLDTFEKTVLPNLSVEELDNILSLVKTEKTKRRNTFEEEVEKLKSFIVDLQHRFPGSTIEIPIGCDEMAMSCIDLLAEDVDNFYYYY